MTPEEWKLGIEHEAVSAPDECWSAQTIRFLRRRQLLLSLLKLGTEFSLPLVLVVLMWPALDQLATEQPFLRVWVLELTGNRPAAGAPWPLLESGAWICVAAVWFMVRAVHEWQGIKMAVALACLWLGALPTWGFQRLAGLVAPLPDWLVLPAALGLLWLWWNQRAARHPAC